VIAALRADAGTRAARVLLMFEHKEATISEVAVAGADDRLAAPFSLLQLQVKLRRLLDTG
jgi:CheY-like chemotaxis protein